MAKYYFDIDDGEVETRDSEGRQVESREDVRRAAISVLPELARDVLPNGDQHTLRVKVRDAHGHVVYLATLSLVAGWLD